MKQRPRIYYSESQKALMWERRRRATRLTEQVRATLLGKAIVMRPAKDEALPPRQKANRTPTLASQPFEPYETRRRW
jgi:hypothetical protein